MDANRVAIVTGVASGIGRATALHLAENGYRVFGITRRDVVEQLSGVTLLKADVRVDDQVREAVGQVLASTGRIDVLVNSAGYSVIGPFEELGLEAARAMMDTNLFGAVRFSQAVLGAMRKQRSGRLIHVGSVLGFLPAPYMAIYSASKHALEGFSESIDHEIRGFGVRSIVVEPTFMRTNIAMGGGLTSGSIPDYAGVRDRARTNVESRVNAGGDPTVVAHMVLKVAEIATPRLRYQVGKKAGKLAVLRSWMPEGIFDSALRKQFGLSAP